MSDQPTRLRLDLLEAMIGSLDAFLASKDLTRVVPVLSGGEMHRPAMSLGLLLDEVHGLSGSDCDLDEAQRDRLLRLKQVLDDAREASPSNFADHLMRELSSQVRAWDRFVEDLADDPYTVGAAPASEMARRSRIDRLLEAAAASDDIDALRLRLAAIDRSFERLRGKR